jgi:hypothetical protein
VPAPRIQWHGKELHLRCKLSLRGGLAAAGKVLHQFYYNMLGQSNAGGESPSMPGEAPRLGTGRGRNAIVSRLNGDEYTLTLRPQGGHLAALDAGTRAHTIRARGKLLRIWFRPKPFRQPTASEIKDIGLRIGNDGRWYYYRKEVRHPGTTEASGPGGGAVGPSPWIRQGFERARAMMQAALVAGSK